VSRMCPATDRKKLQADGECWSAKLLVKGTFCPVRHAHATGCIRLLIRRLRVRVSPPELLRRHAEGRGDHVREQSRVARLDVQR